MSCSNYNSDPPDSDPFTHRVEGDDYMGRMPLALRNREQPTIEFFKGRTVECMKPRPSQRCCKKRENYAPSPSSGQQTLNMVSANNPVAAGTKNPIITERQFMKLNEGFRRRCCVTRK